MVVTEQNSAHSPPGILEEYNHLCDRPEVCFDSPLFHDVDLNFSHFIIVNRLGFDYKPHRPLVDLHLIVLKQDNVAF